MEDLDLLLLAYALGNVLSPTKQIGYLSTESPYTYHGGKETPPPRGYKPFYINAVIRHSEGSFKCSKGVKLWLDTLRHAKARQGLLIKGEALEEQLIRLIKVQKQQGTRTQTKGQLIQQELATRMYTQYPQVFGRKVIATCTATERTRESMHYFLHGLGEQTSQHMFKASVNGRVDPILRFFDLNRAYGQYQKQGKWRQQVADYRTRDNCTKEVLEQFFKPKYLQTIQHKERLVKQLYEIYINQYEHDEAVGIGHYFTNAHLKYYADNRNLENYLMRGPSNVDEYLPTQIAFGLLGDFLVTTERAINQDDVSANLRFAHAETLLPFGDLLEVPGYMVQTNDSQEVGYIWQEQFIVPRGANIKWVLYRKDTDKDLLIKMLYNEKEVPFPIESKQKPYYKWSEVRAYYIQTLQKMHIRWRGDIVEIVKNYQPS